MGKVAEEEGWWASTIQRPGFEQPRKANMNDHVLHSSGAAHRQRLCRAVIVALSET